MKKKTYIRPQAKRYEIRLRSFLQTSGTRSLSFGSDEDIKDEGEAESKGTHIWDDME